MEQFSLPTLPHTFFRFEIEINPPSTWKCIHIQIGVHSSYIFSGKMQKEQKNKLTYCILNYLLKVYCHNLRSADIAIAYIGIRLEHSHLLQNCPNPYSFFLDHLQKKEKKVSVHFILST